MPHFQDSSSFLHILCLPLFPFLIETHPDAIPSFTTFYSNICILALLIMICFSIYLFMKLKRVKFFFSWVQMNSNTELNGNTPKTCKIRVRCASLFTMEGICALLGPGWLISAAMESELPKELRWASGGKLNKCHACLLSETLSVPSCLSLPQLSSIPGEPCRTGTLTSVLFYLYQ